MSHHLNLDVVRKIQKKQDVKKTSFKKDYGLSK